MSPKGSATVRESWAGDSWILHIRQRYFHFLSCVSETVAVFFCQELLFLLNAFSSATYNENTIHVFEVVKCLLAHIFIFLIKLSLDMERSHLSLVHELKVIKGKQKRSLLQIQILWIRKILQQGYYFFLIETFHQEEYVPL